MFKNLIFKDMQFGEITIKEVPLKVAHDGYPAITKGVKEKIIDLVIKAQADKLTEINFSEHIGGI